MERKRIKKLQKAQATLELAVGLLMVMLLIVATVKIFVWLNESMVKRQWRYEDTRDEAGSVEGAVDMGALHIDETGLTPEDMKIPGERTGVIENAFETLNIIE